MESNVKTLEISRWPITYVFAESLFPKLEVVGSSPIARSIFLLWFQTENSDTFLEPSGSVAHTFDMN